MYQLWAIFKYQYNWQNWQSYHKIDKFYLSMTYFVNRRFPHCRTVMYLFCYQNGPNDDHFSQKFHRSKDIRYIFWTFPSYNNIRKLKNLKTNACSALRNFYSQITPVQASELPAQAFDIHVQAIWIALGPSGYLFKPLRYLFKTLECCSGLRDECSGHQKSFPSIRIPV